VANTSASISPKTIYISGVAISPIAFGSAPGFLTSTSGLIGGTSLGGNVTYATNDGKSAGGYFNVGSYNYAPIVSGYNPNYVIGGTSDGNFTINPATLTYVANSTTGVAGQPFPSLTGSVEGFLPGENQGNATNGGLSFQAVADSNSSAGNYPIYGSGLSASNYIFNQASVNGSALTLTAPAPSVFAFNPAAHSQGFDQIHNELFDYDFLAAFYNAKANAFANGYNNAYVLKYIAAQQNAHANAYDYAYDYAFEYYKQNAKANAHYQAVFGQ
jgi:hypothetical protein